MAVSFTPSTCTMRQPQVARPTIMLHVQQMEGAVQQHRWCSFSSAMLQKLYQAVAGIQSPVGMACSNYSPRAAVLQPCTVHVLGRAIWPAIPPTLIIIILPIKPQHQCHRPCCPQERKKDTRAPCCADARKHPDLHRGLAGDVAVLVDAVNSSKGPHSIGHVIRTCRNASAHHITSSAGWHHISRIAL